MLKFVCLVILALILIGVTGAQPANVSKELLQYVTEARSLGLKGEQIQANASKAGFPPTAVKEAIAYLDSRDRAPLSEQGVPSPAKSDGADAAATPAAASVSANATRFSDAEPAPPPKTRGVADDFRIGEGDVVQISVWRQPEASVESAVVRPDGKVSMPLIKEMAIAGLTPIEAEKAVREQMSAFINVPDVTVVVREIHSKKVYVVGAVNHPGPLPYTYQMTILQAISEAGGITDYAKRKKIYVLRSQDGKESRLPFNYDAVLKGQQMELNIKLQAGDTLVVPN